MNQQGILLTALGVIVVGIATALGVHAFRPDMAIQYSINMEWSESVGAYVATVPELPGVIDIAEDPIEATTRIVAKAYWVVEEMRERGEEPPPPHVLATCEEPKGR